MIRHCKYGIAVDGPGSFELVWVHTDKKLGSWLVFRGKRQEIEIRVTAGGQLRVSKPRKAGQIRAGGFEP